MTGHACLNCGNLLSDKYCEKCGQISTTHRFSLSHVFAHDFLHGIFHIHKGLLFTIKELFVRPGHAVREFIQGKRVIYFNYFTLLVMVITVGVILNEFTTTSLTEIIAPDPGAKEFTSVLEQFSRKYPRLFTFSTIPIIACFSWFWFRKAKLNYAEHLVLNAYRASGELILNTCFTAISIFVRDMMILRSIYTVLIFSVIAYSITFYYQLFSAYGFTKGKLFTRSLMTSITLMILSMIFTIAYFIYRAANGHPPGH